MEFQKKRNLSENRLVKLIIDIIFAAANRETYGKLIFIKKRPTW